VIYFQERRFERAVACLRRALTLKSGLNAATTLLAISLAELGRYKEALPELEKTFRESPAPDATRMCGLQRIRAYDNLQRENEAVEEALRLNQLFPDDPEILYQTGRVYGNYAFVTLCLCDNAQARAGGS
jgi:tetratricopeptide (TPR) repeat protein